MKIYLIHGEHSTKSYERLKEYIDKAKEKKWKIVNISSLPTFSFQEHLTSKDLFINKKLFIIENISIPTKKEIAWLNKNIEILDSVLVIFSKNSVKSTFIKSIKKFERIEEFKLPQNVFSFLESFYPKNSEKCIKYLHGILEKENIEFVFYLLSRHLRDLYWAKTSPSNIPYPSWRVAKLEKQAARFSSLTLKNIIGDLSEIDVISKTSNKSLIDLLDLVIIRKLE